MKNRSMSTDLLYVCEHMSTLGATGDNSCPQVGQPVTMENTALFTFSHIKEHEPMQNTMFPISALQLHVLVSFVTTLSMRMLYFCGLTKCWVQ